jgi:SAM-dependent methyltransferase
VDAEALPENGEAVTPAVYEWVKSLGLKGKCLDVGSYNVNGCVRDLFADYTGLDMRPGPNVDVVANAKEIPFPRESFDVVTCLEMIEHDQDPFWSVEEMKRVLRPGGSLVITVPGIGFPRHDYPSDYWRFTDDGLRILMAGLNDLRIHEDRDHVYGVGVKA